jgi:diguanylate cyclase (GGDEF)-like protein
MPKMDGLSMCEAIQAFNPNIPIVVTSAHNDSDFLKKSIDIGVDAYAMKPVDLYQLLECMIKAMEPIILRRQLEELNSSLENKVEEGIKQIKLILDAQDNIVIVTNGSKISHVNKKFLEFFDVESIDEFFQKSSCIDSYFKKEDNFFSQDKIKPNQTWVQSLRELPDIKRVVKIQDKQEEDKVFAVTIHEYDEPENNGVYYVISLTDITQIKQKSNLLEYQANHDQLTGLYNRQKFDSILTKEIRRSRRYGHCMSLILFDIDYFKDVNDTYGHDIGDKVLIEFSELIKPEIRQTDTLVRWGGEEFILILPETALNTAYDVAQKLRILIQEHKFEAILHKITASFGVVQLQKEDTEHSSIIRVDHALYEAKKRGRNIVVSQE